MESQPNAILDLLQELIDKAIQASLAARREWDLKPVQDRAQILFKAADVISGPKRAEILAKTMIGQVGDPWRSGDPSGVPVTYDLPLAGVQGKTVVQAEIDAAAELIDFFRFNAKHAVELEAQQPISTKESTNTALYRGLEVGSCYQGYGVRLVLGFLTGSGPACVSGLRSGSGAV